MSRLMRTRGLPSLHEGLKTAHGMGARVVACSQSLELLGLARESLIAEVDDVAGAAAFLESASSGTVITLS
jgi:peroxiredoxin family protein